MGSAMDGISHNMVWQDENDNRNVAYLNWNEDCWYMDFNWLENDWNGNDRLLSLRNSLYSPL